MNFTTAVIHKVSDLNAATVFFKEQLGFNAISEVKEGKVVENGALAIRLVQATPAVSQLQVLNLEVQTRDISKTTEQFLEHESVYLISEKTPVSQQRIETVLQAPHGLIVTLVQEFNEDELGILPPLPTSLVWDEDAENCIRKILRQIPIGFREGARIRITESAETLAAEEGLITVDIPKAIKALAQVTPHFQHPGVVKALNEMGIDPEGLFTLDAQGQMGDTNV